MKKVLFMVNAGPISSNQNGGASVYYSHIELLKKIGYDIELLVTVWNNKIKFVPDDYQEIESFITKSHVLNIDYRKKNTLFTRFFEAITDPISFEYSFVNPINKKSLLDLIQQVSPNLIWSEWRWNALLACQCSLNIPIIYSHHDWEYKLAKLRTSGNLNKRFHLFQKKRAEYQLVKSASACVSGSKTEAVEIRAISKKEALYLPTTYENVKASLKPTEVPKIIHLGGMNTTANRLGLDRFLEVCWNPIKKSIPNVKLVIIGSLKGASSALFKTIEEDSNIESLGFVKDLDSVMHAGDIHIIPWEYNTGTRTRVPVVMNYQQVLVATKESVKAFPELVDNENVMLSTDLQEMISHIQLLYQDASLRNKISRNAKQTFLNTFTVASQKEKLQKFLDKIVK